MAAVNSLMSDLSEEQLKQARNAFSFFDRNHDGSISAKELGTALRAIGLNPTELEVNEMLTSVDLNHDGVLSFEEFAKLYSLKVADNLTEAQITDYLRAFDRNGDGSLNAEEISEVLTTIGERLSKDEMISIISDFDSNHDGKINIEEFARALVSHS
jgi:calmodulin